MTDILLLGAGKIGEVIAYLLGETGDYTVTAADVNTDNLARLRDFKNASALVLDLTDHDALLKAMDGKFAVLSATPFHLNAGIVKAAHEAGVHYLDLTEDVESTKLVKSLSKDCDQAFIPQCGLAPGFISISAAHTAAAFDTLDEVKLRVGALPQFPTNALKYNLTWSTDGLINEYVKPCEAIVRNEMREVQALEDREEFSLDGVLYEAFNTSGGLGTLAETWAGQVASLNYKTVRYPGHRDLVKLLLKDLRLADDFGLAKSVIEHAIPFTDQDVVLILVSVTGRIEGRLTQRTYARKVYARTVAGRYMTAIQITTASGICAVLDLLHEGALPAKGFVRQEDIPFDKFIENRFGANYAYEGDDHHRF